MVSQVDGKRREMGSRAVRRSPLLQIVSGDSRELEPVSGLPQNPWAAEAFPRVPRWVFGGMTRAFNGNCFTTKSMNSDCTGLLSCGCLSLNWFCLVKRSRALLGSNPTRDNQAKGASMALRCPGSCEPGQPFFPLNALVMPQKTRSAKCQRPIPREPVGRTRFSKDLGSTGACAPILQGADNAHDGFAGCRFRRDVRERCHHRCTTRRTESRQKAATDRLHIAPTPVS